MGKFKSLGVLIGVFVLVSCAQNKFLLNKSTFVPYKEFDKKSMFTPNTEVMSVNVIDGRENKEFLGMAKTGARYLDTPLVASDETPQQFLESYYLKNLRERGLLITDAAEAQIEIVINELWTDELQEKFKGERAKCHIDLTVFGKKGSETFKGSYWSKIKSAANLGDGSDHLAPTLASCLNTSVEKIVKNGKFETFLRK
jgi:uncharacterized lipoprotein YajG